MKGGATELVYPIQCYALVLDYPDNEAAAGTIYLDDLAAAAQ